MMANKLKGNLKKRFPWIPMLILIANHCELLLLRENLLNSNVRYVSVNLQFKHVHICAFTFTKETNEILKWDFNCNNKFMLFIVELQRVGMRLKLAIHKYN